MDWKADYAKKVTTPSEALKVVRSGDRVVFAHACGEPQELVDALVARAPELRDVEIVHMVAMGKGEYARPEYSESFYHNSLFVGGATRDAVTMGRGDYTPVFFSDIPALFTDGYLPPDVVLCQVSPPDRHGFCSFGISVDYTKPACTVAKTVIALVNPNMPRTHGDSFIHVSDLDIVVESTAPIVELQPPRIGPVEEAIGKHIASLVGDGSCLQLGIGGIPEAVTHQRSGLLVGERDPDALFHAMRRLAEEPELFYTLGRAGALAVREAFEHSNQIEKLETYYDEARALYQGRNQK